MESTTIASLYGAYTLQFDGRFEALVINWCDKPETVNLSLGYMPRK